MVEVSSRYFQRYSSAENTISDNTMRLFKFLSEEGVLNKFLNNLNIISEDLEPRIFLQVKEKKSVLDAVMKQPEYKIIIEFKIKHNFVKTQLINHLTSFKDYHGDNKILLTIGDDKIDENIKNEVESKCSKEHVKLVDITYDDIVKTLYKTVEGKKLDEIANDYEDYCLENGLLFADDKTMLTVPVSFSLDVCKKYNLYYCPSNRKYRSFGYIGLYNNKEIVLIGKLKSNNPIKVDIKNKSIANIHTNNTEIKYIIENAFEEVKNIDSGFDKECQYNFYMMEKLCDCSFKKNSPGGLQGAKKFQLNNLLKDFNIRQLTIEEIVEELNKQIW